ncbi:DNA-directed RNA polymerase subunit alpha [Candidatus Woesebacteria bacterium]|nr:DNA-directed RNA polymerase subunit alpha [Candidatus Woesebacteria bacterium]
MSLTITNYPGMNPSFLVSSEELSPVRSRIALEPLDQGYGHTLGNSMRRVLLSSLPGSAITSVRIEGADHQFTTLSGVTEDVLELTLNLKQVRIKATGVESIGTLRLSAKGDTIVTAAQIEPSAGFEIINPDQHIATLAKGGKLELEMTVQSGVGYVPATDSQAAGLGEIVLDALYSPVVKVSYQVDATRVGRRTDFDKLVLDVQTDGTITPLEAVQLASRILAKQFTQVVEPVVQAEPEPDVQLSPEEAEVLRLTVEELDLPTRIANALRKGGFKTVGDLAGVPRNTVAKVKNLGGKSVVVIEAALEKKGITLGE